MGRLTKMEAFEAMSLFLQKYYESTRSDDVGALLGSMMFLDDGGTADPAVWEEWMECVRYISSAGKPPRG